MVPTAGPVDDSKRCNGSCENNESIKSPFIRAQHVLFCLVDSDRPLATQIILTLPMAQRCKQVLLKA